MSPEEPMITLNERNNPHEVKVVKLASGLTVLAGIWLFVSPWVYGATINLNAWNSWLVGGALIFFAGTRVAYPAIRPGLSWFNVVLGVWTFISPWIYGYTFNTGRFINSLCVGVVVVILAVISARATIKTETEVPAGHRI